MIRLALAWSDATGARTVELAGGEAVVGRAEECDLVIEDRAVSRRHARLEQAVDGWWIEDLGSRGGTWLNGRAITRRQRLTDGDRLGIGQSVLAVATSGGAA
ncbi:MAG: FHA domain-containing protein, partial [Thermoanaerobaculia bacterium]|nr:FHA domain-containing protein [Thermoanaerobaculia bacterium]